MGFESITGTNYSDVITGTSGNDIKQPTGGVGLNFVTKRGTNAFHGTVRGYFTHDDLESENVPDELSNLAPQYLALNPPIKPTTPETANHNRQIADYGFDLGGPIVKDKLWFWASWGKQDIRLVRSAGALIDKTLLKDTNVKVNWQAGGKVFADQQLVDHHCGDVEVGVAQHLAQRAHHRELDARLEIVERVEHALHVGPLVLERRLLQFEIALLDRRTEDHVPPDADQRRLRPRLERRHVDDQILERLGAARKPPARPQLVRRARALVSAGRPPCPFCGGPLDPTGHVCPRANGYKR